MGRLVTVAAACGVLAGCVTTPRQLEEAPFEFSEALPVNYQRAFAGIVSGLNKCATAGTGLMMYPTIMSTQLYSELGYGEVRTGIGGAIPMITMARIERSGSGSKISTKSAAPGDHQWLHDRFVAWGYGATDCFDSLNGSGEARLAAFLAPRR